jgi:hypothetical protein
VVKTNPLANKSAVFVISKDQDYVRVVEICKDDIREIFVLKKLLLFP